MALDNFSSYTEALTTWLASNCQDKSQLLQGKALEDAKQLVGCRSLSEPNYQFLISSQELEKQELLKQLEVARQETQDVKQQIASFLANARTELATPINNIICSLKLIIDGFIDDEPELEREEIKRAFIDEAHRSALNTLDLVNELAAMAGFVQPETTPLPNLNCDPLTPDPARPGVTQPDLTQPDPTLAIAAGNFDGNQVQPVTNPLPKIDCDPTPDPNPTRRD